LKPRFALKMASAVVLTAVLLSLSSCLSVTANADITSDGSGTLSLVYTVPRELQSLGAMDPSAKYLPFPTDRADFEAAATTAGLTLASYDEKYTETDLVIPASLSFADTAALSSFVTGGGRTLEIQSSEADTVLHLVLSNGKPVPDAPMRDTAAALFRNYAVNLSVHLPSSVKSIRAGSLDAAKRTVTYSVPTMDLVNAVQPIELTIRY
jgi:hypothetical protein